MKESLRHREAFEFYYSLGEARSMQKVADHFNLAKSTVHTWSKKFNWTERIEQRDFEIGRKLEEKTNDTILDEKAKLLAITKKLRTDFAKRVQKEEVQVESVQDFERIVKIMLLLMGEATEKTEQESKVVDKKVYEVKQQIEHDPESRELFKQLYRRHMERSRGVNSEG